MFGLKKLKVLFKWKKALDNWLKTLTNSNGEMVEIAKVKDTWLKRLFKSNYSVVKLVRWEWWLNG